jgi:plasmid stabilization system protein ParE
VRIVWSEPAIDDLEAIRDYIARDSEVYARSFIAELLGAVDRLDEFPESGRQVPEAEDQPQIREVIYRGYRLIYRLERTEIVILTVLHGAQDLGGAQPKPWAN